MGGSSGKLVVDQFDAKTKSRATVDHEKIIRSRKQSSQLVNGEANGVNDIPPIDGVPEEHALRRHTQCGTITNPDETGEHSLSGDGPNGVLSRSDSDSGAKKNQSHLKWIKRHLSLNSSLRKKHNEETAAAQPPTTSEATTENITTPVLTDEPALVEEPPAVSHEEVNVAANALVEEAISSAMMEEEEQVSHSPIPELAPVLEQKLNEPGSSTQESTDPNANEPSTVPCHEEPLNEITAKPVDSSSDNKQEEEVTHSEMSASPCQLEPPSEPADESESCEAKEPPAEPTDAPSNPPPQLASSNEESNLESEESESEVEDCPFGDTNNTNVYVQPDTAVLEMPSPNEPDDEVPRKFADLESSGMHQEINGIHTNGAHHFGDENDVHSDAE